MKPMLDRVVILRDDDPEAFTKSGIEIPEMSRQPAAIGTVIAVGEGRLDGFANAIPMALRLGDRVLFPTLAGTENKVGEETHLIMYEADVLAILVRGGERAFGFAIDSIYQAIPAIRETDQELGDELAEVMLRSGWCFSLRGGVTNHRAILGKEDRRLANHCESGRGAEEEGGDVEGEDPSQARREGGSGHGAEEGQVAP